MAAQSTMRMAVLHERRCCVLVHPWTRSCSDFYLSALRHSVLSTASVFTPLYCLPLVIKILTTGVRRNEVQEALINSIRTTLYVSLHVSLSLGMSCVFRALLGCYTEYSAVLFPTVVAGVGLLAEDPKHWNAAMVMLGNTLLERLLLVGERETGLPLSSTRLTYLFMASSGALLYLLRRTDFRYLLQSGDTPWFFYPPLLKKRYNNLVDDKSLRFHKELKETGRLMAAGFALQLLRLLVKNFRRPAAIFRHLRRFNTYRLCLFLSGYSLLYKGCSWALARAHGRDAAWHALPAGLLAGAALRVYPQRTVALMATTTLLQILIKWFCKKKGVKNIQIWKYLFVSTSTGYLVHSYFVDPVYCPIWFNQIMTSISGGIAEDLRKKLIRLWHPTHFPAIVGGL